MATADTRERLLSAAELLFAKQGFAATSVRNIIAEAGVNLAAVHYHFGSRAELMRAVFARRFAPINEERLRRLGELEASAGRAALRIEDILGCLIEPIVRAAEEEPEGWSLVGEIVGRVHLDADLEARQILHEQFEEVGERFLAVLGEALPKIGQEELYYRFHFAIAAMAMALGSPSRMLFLSGERGDSPGDPALFAERWISFVAAGLRAPATAPSRSSKGDAPVRTAHATTSKPSAARRAPGRKR